MRTCVNFHNYFDPLPEQVRAELHKASIIRRFEKGEYIYYCGEKADAIYQVVDGSVRLLNYSADGKEVTMGTFFVGDCFGEMGCIDGSVRQAVAKCLEVSTLRVLPLQAFQDLYHRHIEIAHQMNLVATRRVRLLYGMIEDANVLSLRERLARTLLRLAYGPKREQPDSTDELIITASQEELAGMLGASRQSINKELKGLAESNFIRLAYGKIIISDLDHLADEFETILGAEPLAPNYLG